MSEQLPPPTNQELRAKAEELQRGFAELRDRAARHALKETSRPPGPQWGFISLMTGIPVGAAVGGWFLFGSILASLLAAVGAALIFFAVFAFIVLRGPVPPSLKPGTRAWEAKLTVQLLERVLTRLAAERSAAQDPADQARREREIEFLRGQLREQQLIWGSEDPSPGKGYIQYEPYAGE